MNVLEVRNLSVRFGGLLAIESLDLEVREGEVLSLIGPNGAGKTTAFNAITGYLAPAAGEIVFLGKRINGRKASEIAALGLVRTFQKTSLFAGRSALENILIGLHLRSKQTPLAVMLGLPSVAREERALEKEAERILNFVGLEKKSKAPKVRSASLSASTWPEMTITGVVGCCSVMRFRTSRPPSPGIEISVRTTS